MVYESDVLIDIMSDKQYLPHKYFSLTKKDAELPEPHERMVQNSWAFLDIPQNCTWVRKACYVGLLVP
jgi:hypothetical protein